MTFLGLERQTPRLFSPAIVFDLVNAKWLVFVTVLHKSLIGTDLHFRFVHHHISFSCASKDSFYASQDNIISPDSSVFDILSSFHSSHSPQNLEELPLPCSCVSFLPQITLSPLRRFSRPLRSSSATIGSTPPKLVQRSCS